MINLEQDFIKFETDGTLAYYGYKRNLSAKDNDNAWSIRLMTGTGSSFDVKWSNNSRLNYISKQSDKTSYFAPGSASFGLTWSVVNINDNFNYLLNVEWNDVPGYDIYNIYIRNNRGSVVSKSGYEIVNVYSPNSVQTDTLFSNGTDKLKFQFKAPIGLTYSFNLGVNNGFGQLSESFTFSN